MDPFEDETPVNTEPLPETMEATPDAPSVPEVLKESQARKLFFDASAGALERVVAWAHEVDTASFLSYAALIGLMANWPSLGTPNWFVPAMIWFTLCSEPVFGPHRPFVLEGVFLVTSLFTGPFSASVYPLALVWLFAPLFVSSTSLGPRGLDTRIGFLLVALGWTLDLDLAPMIWVWLVLHILGQLQRVVETVPESLHVYTSWLFVSITLAFEGVLAIVCLASGFTHPAVWGAVVVLALRFAQQLDTWHRLSAEATSSYEKWATVYTRLFGNTSVADLVQSGRWSQLVSVFLKA